MFAVVFCARTGGHRHHGVKLLKNRTLQTVGILVTFLRCCYIRRLEVNNHRHCLARHVIRMTDPRSSAPVSHLSVAIALRRLHHICAALHSGAGVRRKGRRRDGREIRRLDADKRFGVARGSSGHEPTQTSFVILIRPAAGRPAVSRED